MGINKHSWLARHLRCPQCYSIQLVQSENSLRCRMCDADYPHVMNAVNFIDEDSRKHFNLEDTANISDHPYDERAQKIIAELVQSGGMALDCGSGKKSVFFENVVQLEIVPYPHVDILAVNQALPFQDNVFDAVFSLDVLEHVNDPFLCAREIVRVLKPGGVLYLDMPFLQPEHGYPHHYFNATRMGVERLFEKWMTFEQHYVPLSGHPIFTLTWFLTHYQNHLDPGVREQFSQMTVEQFVSKSPIEWLGDPIVSGLPQDSQWPIAATTQAMLRKSAGETRANSLHGGDDVSFLKNEVKRLENELKTMAESNSWRITAPLRLLGAKLRG